MIVNFRLANPIALPKLERSLRINDDIMRHLVLRYDAKMERHYTQQKADSASAKASA